LFATPAMAQTAGAPSAGPMGLLINFAPIIAMVVLFYFLLIRPQQRRAKAHRELIAGVKRGDTVVMSSGMIGKVTKVDEAEVSVEIAPNVSVKVVKAMIADVRSRGEPAAANDLVK
jgi:preprotein translocase subunit YajC